MEESKTERIKFSKSAVRMFQEMRRRHNQEINEALQELYEELGIRPRIDAQGETGEQISLDPRLAYIEFVTPPKEKKDGPESTSKAK